MLNQLIAWALTNRGLVLLLAGVLLVAAGVLMPRMPVDVFPELNAPTVTIMTEAPGYASEEVELAVSFPVETAINGIPGVRRVRSSSASGLSIVWAEFGFGEDIYRARQLIAERLSQAREALPENIHAPEMTPIASITGEVMLIALTSPDGKISPLALRRTAEFDLRTRILAIAGVAQVTAIGGEMPEYQVHVRPADLQRYGLTLEEVTASAAAAHAPVGGGYLENVGGRELPLRPMTRAKTTADLASTVVGSWRGTPITLGLVADVHVGPAPKRGTAAVGGRAGVVLVVQKNPGTNTLQLTKTIDSMLDNFESTLPAGFVLERRIFRQADFIDVAVSNVLHALRDGVIFVTIVIFLFLVNVRTTFITLTALPLSIGATLILLWWLGASINVMTLGGIAVAIGSLVDDAIVDVENVFRRLRENVVLPEAERRSKLRVVFDASVEVRSAILLATIIIVLVFVPLFFLSGVEGRFFRPLGLAYVLSLAVSLVVAMTVTPVLCYYLLGRSKVIEGDESWFVRFLKRGYRRSLVWSLGRKPFVLVSAGLLVLSAILVGSTYGSSFLPDFNEGSVTVFLNAPAGTSLTESDRLARRIEMGIQRINGVAAVTRRTGRAERDEHAEPPSSSEIDVRLEPGADPVAVRRDLVKLFDNTPGITSQLGGPIAHRLSHILSGTPAAVAIKIFGDDLSTLRRMAKEIESELKGLPGVRDLVANREVLTDTLPIYFDRHKLALYGLTPGEAARQLETAFLGRQVGSIFAGSARYDVVVRLEEQARVEPKDVADFLLYSKTGAHVRLAEVAEIREQRASNLITRENVKRKAVISCNVDEGYNLGDLVAEIETRVDPIVANYPRTFVRYGGQFEAQEEASARILWLSLAVLLGIAAVLYNTFRSVRPVALIMLNLPLALVGGVIALFLADSPNLFGNIAGLFGIGTYVPPVVSIASLVGFIGLAGVACRNGLLLISHYYHLMEEVGLSKADAVLRGAEERLVPILMTALSSALALIPLVLAKGQIGSELQYPLAVVMLGGFVSSTLLNLIVVPIGFELFGGGPRERTADRGQDDLLE